MPVLVDLLDLSNTHLPAPLADNFADAPGVTAEATAMGWLMTVPAGVSPDPGGALGAICGYARALGCRLVLFTDDADPVDGLPVWQ